MTLYLTITPGNGPFSLNTDRDCARDVIIDHGGRIESYDTVGEIREEWGDQVDWIQSHVPDDAGASEVNAT